ncbi:MAG: DNA repair protein RadA [Candidatus Doudnabacteria bacterium CG10_big_fil_rev_8_21_14_0_10_41_10]|uniref:DNA repair protein RadA n=1 Tax=Candidatus Doudnabacteria bacterium CG10_big_fil_rev_8_21_14_0_10_41_10 TaxID=1974551 RepID=A0A2H0VG21_9BACT|nr:MAG: DNA repair protein RadA [Candidatus Doudnabacteria bacterium CG10_big_fil_rev_8_21_14_0_10_41_10]
MKNNSIFICTNCDAQSPKWSGRCLDCGKWNTLEESAVSKNVKSENIKPAKVATLDSVDSKSKQRFSTGIGEVDQVLGASADVPGFVSGSLVLLGGDPGIGKSTLALQIALNSSKTGLSTLYVSGEESLSQIRLRAERITNILDKLRVLSETNLEVILATMESIRPVFVIIDSIQTMYSESATGVAGGLSQVSMATARILQTAKPLGITVLIIGHVTKEGNLAGPRTLEHMVDVVMYLEGERFMSSRILRCVKNRFGGTNEVGVFEMKAAGLSVVKNPSEVFLSERSHKKAGSAITCTVEGTRPLLLEVQSLTTKTQFNYPKRTATGFDYNRLQLISAVIQKSLRIDLFSSDVFVSVAGGFKITETACDLALAMSVVSSLKEKMVPEDTVMVGELGLTGEIRRVGQIEKRIAEAAKLGFKKMIIPTGQKVTSTKIKLVPVADLAEAVRAIG